MKLRLKRSIGNYCEESFIQQTVINYITSAKHCTGGGKNRSCPHDAQCYWSYEPVNLGCKEKKKKKHCITQLLLCNWSLQTWWLKITVINYWSSQGQRCLAGYIPRGRKESDTNEHAPMHACNCGSAGASWSRLRFSEQALLQTALILVPLAGCCLLSSWQRQKRRRASEIRKGCHVCSYILGQNKICHLVQSFKGATVKSHGKGNTYRYGEELRAICPMGFTVK